MAVETRRYRFANEDGTPYHRSHDRCAEDELLDWLGPSLYVLDSGQPRKIETWNPTTMRRLAAQCAEHVLLCFEAEYPEDERPGLAVSVGYRRVNQLASQGAMAAHGTARTDAKAMERRRVETLGMDVTKVHPSMYSAYCVKEAAAQAALAAAIAARTESAGALRACLKACESAAEHYSQREDNVPIAEIGAAKIRTANRGRVGRAAVAAERAFQRERLWELIRADV